MSYLFTVNTPFSEFIENIKRRNACSEAVYWGQLDKNKNMTFKEVMNDFVKDDTAEEAWAIWVLTFYYNFLDDELRILFFKKIKDEMSAFSLYVDMEKLTDEEEKILKDKFEGKLPTAEMELKTNKIKRKKS